MVVLLRTIKIVEIKKCTRLLFSKLSISIFARESDFSIVETEIARDYKQDTKIPQDWTLIVEIKIFSRVSLIPETITLHTNYACKYPMLRLSDNEKLLCCQIRSIVRNSLIHCLLPILGIKCCANNDAKSTNFKHVTSFNNT